MTTPGRKKSIASSAAVPGLSIDQPVAAATVLNKQAGTSLYQQCSILRSRLLKIHDFSPYLDLIAAPDKDVVRTLWDCFALGTPLCFLFNLLDLPVSDRIQVDTDPADIDTDNLREKKRAAAFFIMGIQRLKKNGQWDDLVDLFNVTELLANEDMNTNGFVKVVATITHLLDRLPVHVWMEEEVSPEYLDTNDITPWDSLPGPDGAPTLKPGGMEAVRVNTLREIIETERKYVQDLEVMHNYARALMQQDVVDQDTIHHLFPGLNKLLDFQRKFLIEFEQQYELPWDQQRWGKCFIVNEPNFAVYEPYCANFSNASELALQEEPHLMAVANIITPKELQAFLIKPIQRICKYPLLFQQLLKACPPDHEFYQELEEGVAACKRITEKVNEAERRAVNAATVKLLEQRVEDWKGHALANFGELLLEDIFMVTKSDVDREYHVFLFEKIILCCKDATNIPNKKVAKSNSILKKTNSTQTVPATPATSGAAARKKTTPLLLKGRIFLNNVTQAVPNTKGGQYALQVWWRGDDDLEYFTLRCKNDDQMKQWESAITKLIRDLQVKRGEKVLRDVHARTISISTSSAASHPLPPYSGPPAPRGGRYAGYPEEKPPPVPQYLQYSNPGSNGYPYYGQNWRNDGFETEEDGYESSQGSGGYNSVVGSGGYSESGRGTPIGAANGRRGTAALSMPPERDVAPGYDRERARTGDSVMLAQWSRQHSHNGSLATNGMPLPPMSGNPFPQRPIAARNPSSQSAASMGSISGMSDVSFGNGVNPRGPSLRSQFSSNRLRSGYTEDGDDKNNGYGQYSDGPAGPPQQRTPPTNPHLGLPNSRNRSISNPAAYPQAQLPKQPLPPMPLAPHWTGPSQPSAGIDRERIAAGASRERLAGARSQQGILPPLRRPNSDASSDYSDESPDSGMTSGPATTPLRSTRSQIFNGSRGDEYTSLPNPSQGPPVKIKVFWGEDLFMIIVPRTTTYSALAERVQRKIRLCGGDADAPTRLKYDDEDGDKISLTTDEELQMAFDMVLSRSTGQAQLTLRVEAQTR